MKKHCVKRSEEVAGDKYGERDRETERERERERERVVFVAITSNAMFASSMAIALDGGDDERSSAGSSRSSGLCGGKNYHVAQQNTCP